MNHPIFSTRLALGLLLAALLTVTACGDTSPAKPTLSAHPAALADLVQEVMQARDAGKTQRLYDLVFQLHASESDLREVLRPGPKTDAFLAEMQPRPLSRERTEEMNSLASFYFVRSTPEQTEIQVHEAPTEALTTADTPPGVEEFPGGMGRFAREIAAPGRSWWTVELLEPGQDSGMRYTCFTRLGERWIAVPKPWRHLPRDE